MAFVQAHFSSAHPSRLLDFRRQDTRANNTLSEPARRLLYFCFVTDGNLFVNVMNNKVPKIQKKEKKL